MKMYSYNSDAFCNYKSPKVRLPLCSSLLHHQNAKASIETSLSLWVKEEEDEETKKPREEAEVKYPMTYPSRIECAKILIELEEYDVSVTTSFILPLNQLSNFFS